MFHASANASHPPALLLRYRTSGAWLGGGLGLLAGVVASGPHFIDWTGGEILQVVGACCAGGTLVGYLAGRLLAGSAAQPAGTPGGTACSEGAWPSAHQGSGDGSACDGGGD